MESNTNDTIKTGEDTLVSKGTDTQPVVEAKFTQDELDRIITARLAEEKRRNEAKNAEDRKKAAEKAALEAGEYKTVAEQRAAQILELEERLKQVDAEREEAETILNAQLEERFKTLPKELQGLIPSGNYKNRYEAIVKAEEAAKKLVPQPAQGTPFGVRGSGAPIAPSVSQDELVRQRLIKYGGSL